MKRFRFSLLSLVVGVVLLCGLLGLNLSCSRSYPAFAANLKSREPKTQPIRLPLPTELIHNVRSYGWPLLVCDEYQVFKMNYYDGLWKPYGHERWRIHLPGLAANIAIGLVIVFGGAGVCEWLVRRRAKAKE